MNNEERAARFRMARTQLNQNGKETLHQVRLATGVAESAIHDYENPQSDRNPRMRIVNTLAEHYGVNAAWLIGQSDVPIIEEDLQMIVQATGLTDKAIRNLRKLTEDTQCRDLLNAILESEELGNAMYSLKAAAQAKESLSALEEPASADSSENVNYLELMKESGIKVEMKEDSFLDMFLWRSSRLLEKVMREAVEANAGMK